MPYNGSQANNCWQMGRPVANSGARVYASFNEGEGCSSMLPEPKAIEDGGDSVLTPMICRKR